MLKPLSAALLAAIVFSRLGMGQAPEVSQPENSPASRGGAYLQLNRQIYAQHLDPGSGQLNQSKDKFQAASQQLNRMILDEIALALNAPNASSSSITAAILKLQGSLTLAAYDPTATNTPFAEFFKLDGNETVAVAYVIMQGGDGIPDTQPHLVFYDKSSGDWQQKADAFLHDFEGCSFSVAPIDAGVPGEAWFVGWGLEMGSSHGTKRVRLYAFDGRKVRTVWQRNGLDGGKITVGPDTVTLDYFDQDDPSIDRHEVLRVSPGGLSPE